MPTADSVAVLSDMHGVLPALRAVLDEPSWSRSTGSCRSATSRPGGGVPLRRTGFDSDAACTAIAEQSGYSDAAAWAGYFVRSRASDAEALAVLGPRSR